MREIPFSKPDITEAEIAEVTDALRSGWITTGQRTKTLEKRLAKYFRTSKVVCLSSCTAAEELLLRALGIEEGDEVIVPAYTYTATASAAIHAGATIRLVDSQEDALEMDYDQVAELINERTKAIIPVDLAGIPCDYERIFRIVEEKKHLFKASNNPIQKLLGRVAVVADAAHAMGACRYGDRVGNIADFTCFSFHAVKNFTTAEGGAVTWRHLDGLDDEDLYNLFQLMSLHGQNKDALAKTKAGSWEYDIIGTWYKCNMTDITAALGLVQLERYPAMQERRFEIIQKYDQTMDELGITHIDHMSGDYISSGHLYLTGIPGFDEEKRNLMIEKLAERGVSTNVHYKPLPMFTAYKELGFDIKDYPNAYKFYKQEITLPLHTMLTDEDVDYVIEAVKEVYLELK